MLFLRERASSKDAHRLCGKEAPSWIPSTQSESGYTYTEQAREGGRTNNVPNGHDSDHVLAKRSRLLAIFCGGNGDKGRNLNSKSAETSLARVIMSCATGTTSLHPTKLIESSKTGRLFPNATCL